MTESLDDRKYSADTRPYGQAMVDEGFCKKFDESPVSKMLKLNDINKYKPGELSAYTGKETKTSWDSFSYCLLMAHNVWTHITSVQEANRQYDKGIVPGMLVQEDFDRVYFRDLVDEIFSKTDKQEALDLIEDYSDYWMSIIGTRGYVGKKAKNANTQFEALFDFG
jgi:hypothetical protein